MARLERSALALVTAGWLTAGASVAMITQNPWHFMLSLGLYLLVAGLVCARWALVRARVESAGGNKGAG